MEDNKYATPDGAVAVEYTNVAVAEKLGVDHSTVSRIRSGQRYPSRRLMRQIEECYGWKVVFQLGLLPDRGRNLQYAQAFEKQILGKK